MNKIRENIEYILKNCSVLRPGDALPTLREIAAMTGSSVSTVKKAVEYLRSKDYISPIHGSGNYIKSPLPETYLQTVNGARQSRLFGFISRSSSSIFSIHDLFTLTDMVNPYGFEVLSRCSFREKSREYANVESLVEAGIKALLIEPILTDTMPEYIPLLKKQKIPFAFVTGSNFLPELEESVFCCDNQAGIFELMDHLCSLGHKKIAYAEYGSDEDLHNIKRVSAYCAYMRQAGLEPFILNIADQTTINRQLGELFSSDFHATALVCSSDFLAQSSINFLHSSGRRVPDDCSVTGVDNHTWGTYVSPSLTTLDFPAAALSHAAASSLLAQLGYIRQQNFQHRFALKLIIRNSTGAVR